MTALVTNWWAGAAYLTGLVMGVGLLAVLQHLVRPRQAPPGRWVDLPGRHVRTIDERTREEG